MHPTPPRVRTAALVGLVIAIAAVAVPAPRHAAASGSYGTVLVTGPQWAGQYAALGDLNVYDNGDGNQDVNSTYGLQFECVELAQRWAALRYHEQRVWPIGRAAEMWNAAPTLQIPMQQIPNGAGAPQFGDLVIFDATSYDPSGHVAVVADTGPGYVDLVEQNWNHIGFNRVPMSTSTTMPPRWGLNVLGWLRGPGGTQPPVVVSGNYAGSYRKGALVAADSAGWASTGTDTGFPFRRLSGVVTGSLAMVQYPGTSGVDRGTALYIGTGTDQRLWARTDTSEWGLVSPGGRCLDNPAALLTAGPAGVDLLTIGCQGTDHQLWTISGPAPRGAVPYFPGGWTGLGETLAAGPALAVVNGTPTAAVTGSDHRIYLRPLAGGSWGAPTTGLSCIGHPALSSWNNVSWLACHLLDGSAGYASTNGGQWSAGASAGGRILDGPGLTSTSTGQAVLDVTGTDSQVWEANLSTGGATGFAPQGWQVAYGPSFSAMPYPSMVVATENPPDSSLQVQFPLTGTVGLGGTLDGSVATIAVPGGTPLSPTHALYVASFADHTLRVRSDSAPWSPLSASGGPACMDSPGAALINGRLTVACEGTDRQLWYAGGSMPASGLPVLTGWTTPGGILYAGPAVGSVNGTLTFLVVGAANRVYSMTLGQPWAAFQGWLCQGHPALASAGSTTYAACDGADGHLWYSIQTGGNWDPTLPAGGGLVDGPGIAAFAGEAIVAAEGTDGNVYENAVSRGLAPAGWVRLPLSATRGASATAL